MRISDWRSDVGSSDLAVIGHEIGHGFDDQGSKFDPQGNLKSWWTDEDRKNFEARTKALIAQYDGFEALPGKHVNGAFTIGENSGEPGVVSIASQAYNASRDGKESPHNDGVTGDQRDRNGEQTGPWVSGHGEP